MLDRRVFRSVEAGVALIEAFRKSDPDQFKWRDPPYEYEHERLPFDVLAGSTELRQQLEGGLAARDIARSWEAPVDAFMKTRERFLLY
jgi:uncharacterized protein YbbC (DUF1343 family)